MSGVNCWNSLPKEQTGSLCLCSVCLQLDVLFSGRRVFVQLEIMNGQESLGDVLKVFQIRLDDCNHYFYF